MTAIASGAHAAPFTLAFDDPDTATTTVLYSLVSATQPSYSLSARIVFDLTAITASAAMFAVTVTNATATDTPGTNRLVSFGVNNVTPDLTGTAIASDAPGGATWTSLRAENFKGGFGKPELCAIGKSNANNCSGAGHDGLTEGHSDSFVWILYGTFGLTSPTISFTSPIPIRFQSLDGSLWDGATSIAFDALSPQAPPDPPSEPPVTPPPTSLPPVAPPSEQPLQVPEPGSAILVGLGLLGAAQARRRQSHRA